MPSFTSQIPNIERDGPLVDVLIGPSRILIEKLKQENLKIPQPISVKMLFDTGASGTVIQDGLPQKLGLKPLGQTSILTPSSEDCRCLIYQLSIAFPNRVVTECPVIAAPLKGQIIQGLLGRDILRHGIFIYNGYMRQFTFSI